jgi:hypothetical protein
MKSLYCREPHNEAFTTDQMITTVAPVEHLGNRQLELILQVFECSKLSVSSLAATRQGCTTGSGIFTTKYESFMPNSGEIDLV